MRTCAHNTSRKRRAGEAHAFAGPGLGTQHASSVMQRTAPHGGSASDLVSQSESQAGAPAQRSAHGALYRSAAHFGSDPGHASAAELHSPRGLFGSAPNIGLPQSVSSPADMHAAVRALQGSVALQGTPRSARSVAAAAGAQPQPQEHPRAASAAAPQTMADVWRQFGASRHQPVSSTDPLYLGPLAPEFVFDMPETSDEVVQLAAAAVYRYAGAVMACTTLLHVRGAKTCHL